MRQKAKIQEACEGGSYSMTGRLIYFYFISSLKELFPASNYLKTWGLYYDKSIFQALIFTVLQKSKPLIVPETRAVTKAMP